LSFYGINEPSDFLQTFSKSLDSWDQPMEQVSANFHGDFFPCICT
jgi:hypothetical protein